jgi:hypothetical protein
MTGRYGLRTTGAVQKLIEAEDIQAGFLRAELDLGPNVPLKIRQRVETARNLATYGWFCYELYAVSMFWSVSCIEMALRIKFAELHQGPLTIVHKSKGTTTVGFADLEGRFKKGWRLGGMPTFNRLSFRSLLNWAKEAALLPGTCNTLYLATLRNSMAHPEFFNWVVPAEHARVIFEHLTEIVAGLWP